MIGALPAGLFGMIRPNVLGSTDPGMSMPSGPLQPAPAYVNGAGGARLTPEDLAMRQQLAMQNQQAGMDASPVGHWTQGLARVAQALVGNVQQGRLQKASAANAEASSAALSTLGAGGGEQSIAAILADPYLDQGVKDVAKLKWQDTHRAPIQPPQPTEFERMVAAAGYQAGTPEYTSLMKQAVENKANPLQAVPGVDGEGNSVLRFMRPTQMSQGGGDPASTVPRAPVGKLTPIGGAGSGPRTFR